MSNEEKSPLDMQTRRKKTYAKNYQKNKDSKLAYAKKYREEHREQTREASRKHYHENKEKKKIYARAYSYGLTNEQYESLLKSQNYMCAICRTHQKDLKMPLHVDHNHTTGKVRGMLCRDCNLALGLLKDNLFFCKNAVHYLEQEIING